MLSLQIDSSIVGEISDADMAAYIPAYGDRIATRRFCMEQQRRGGGDSKRLSLFEKLKRKMGTTSNKDQDLEEEPRMPPHKAYLRNNKRALKMTRKIELGWIHDKRQVRKRNGGGTRFLNISKNAAKAEILSNAKNLFFPNEKSTKGKWEEFSHDIVDFQEAYLDDGVSVGELYEAHKLGVLRFYLHTESLTNDEVNESEDEEGEVFREMEEGDDMHTEVDDQLTQTNQESEQPTHTVEDEQNTSKVLRSLCDTSEVFFGPMPGGPFLGDLDDTVVDLPIFLPIFQELEGNTNPHTSTPTRGEMVPAAPLIQEGEGNTNAHTSTPIPFEMVPGPPSPLSELLHVTVNLHRVNLLNELITQFKDEEMMTYTVKYSFIGEKGADVDGVSRDVYAAFWIELLDCAAEGAEARVPSLPAKWQEEEWKSIGRILAKGLKDHGYFPSRLAQAFTAAITFGERSVSPGLLYDSLMMYLSQSERDIVSAAFHEDLVGDDEDDLFELVDRMGVRTSPTKENLKALLLQAAHNQLIQRPKYALVNIAEVAGPTLRKFFPSVQEMQKMYADLKPTTRKVLKLFTASPTTPAENQSLGFLRQYIRELDEVPLRKMLRFVTGADVICVEHIKVIFTRWIGLARRPIAHTCGPTLELPSTYKDYPELRAEMENILSSNSFAMDIV